MYYAVGNKDNWVLIYQDPFRGEFMTKVYQHDYTGVGIAHI